MNIIVLQKKIMEVALGKQKLQESVKDSEELKMPR